MEQTESNIKIESDTFALQRDYKYALANMAKIKAEAAIIIATKEKVTKEVEEKQSELTEVLNQIAQEKNDWAQFRHGELIELENKQSEANNVLKRKKELNEQEEALRQIEASDIEVRNETRQLEFRIEQEKTAIEVRENQIKNKEEEVKHREQKLLKESKDFKEKVAKVLEEVINL